MAGGHCASVALGPGSACAAGALAIGQTEDLGKDGYSIGIAVNAGTEAVAQKGALAWCRNNGSPQTRAQCKTSRAFTTNASRKPTIRRQARRGRDGVSAPTQKRRGSEGDGHVPGNRG